MHQNYQNNPYSPQNQAPFYPQGYAYPRPTVSAEQLAAYQQKAQRRKERHTLMVDGVIIGATMIVYLLVQSIIVVLLMATPYYSLNESSSIFQSAFNVIAVHICSMAIPFSVMALILRKRFTGPLIPTEPIGKLKAFAWISVGMGGCMGANLLTVSVKELFEKTGHGLSQPEMLKVDSPLACAVFVVATAIVPAVFEEYALRCCTLGVLKRYGKAFGVVAVSVVFGLLHGNVIQFVFAFLVGVILGYITIVTDSVIPAMFIHGFNNGLGAVQEIVTYTSGKKISENVITVLVVAWVILAAGGLAYLIVKKSFLPKRSTPPAGASLSFLQKLLCLVPGFFLPFYMMIIVTLQYIDGIPKIADGGINAVSVNSLLSIGICLGTVAVLVLAVWIESAVKKAKANKPEKPYE